MRAVMTRVRDGVVVATGDVGIVSVTRTEEIRTKL